MYTFEMLGRFRSLRKMQPTSVQDRLPPPLTVPPVVLLRVECHDENSRKFNGTFQNFNMVARGPNEDITWEAFDTYLSWKEFNTPFIPFTNKWERALRKRQELISNGTNKVVIVAIWSKGLPGVYDAYLVASQLGYHDDGQNPHKRLSNHHDEYLVHRCVWADEYRILALFGGQGEGTNVELHVPGLRLRGTTQIPGTFMTDAPGRTANKKLENEIYVHTGMRGRSEQLLYLIGVMIGAFDKLWMSSVVTPTKQN